MSHYRALVALTAQEWNRTWFPNPNAPVDGARHDVPLRLRRRMSDRIPPHNRDAEAAEGRPVTPRAPIRCVTCGKPIEGCAVTRYDGGWIHVGSRSERCAPPHRTLAAPAKVIAPEPYPRRT